MTTRLFALRIGDTGQLGQFQPSFPNGISQLITMDMNQIFHNVVSIVLGLAVLITFIFFLVGGIRWIMSQGDKKQLETAQKTITYAIIGLLVVLLSFFVINFIGYLFGVKLLGN